jgi:tetratricopeptide (TPR) repeat protein
VLALQSEVAVSLAEAIQGEVSSDDRARAAAARHVDPAAYELYLKGRWAWNRRTEPELRRAIESFERAIERDPTYAQAFAGLGDAYNILSDNNWIPPEVGFARARAAARRALELDPNLAEAHTALAYSILFQDWDWVEAERVFRRAIELDPDYPTARQWYGSLLTSLGRFEEGIASSRRSVELDPLSTILSTSLGDTLYYARRYEESITTYRSALAIDAEFSFSWNDMARSLERAGRFDEAEAAYRRHAELTGRDIRDSSGLACCYAFAGRYDEAREIRDRLVERARTHHVPSYAIASIETGLGDVESAFAWLEKSLAARDRALVWARVNPRFDLLRDDPRFGGLLQRIGFPA